MLVGAKAVAAGMAARRNAADNFMIFSNAIEERLKEERRLKGISN